jgi:hypothetical protein
LAEVRLEHGREEALGTRGSKLPHRPSKPPAIHLPGLGERSRQDSRLVFGKPIKIMQKVDE